MIFMITEKDVLHIADLAKIDLTEDEVERFKEEFQDILGYFDILDEVDEEIEPLYQVIPLKNVFRKDEVKKSLPQKEVLKNTKHNDGEYIKGPRVVE